MFFINQHITELKLEDQKIQALSYAFSGEGALAHGYGVYTAKNKDVSESYRENLTLPEWTYDGKIFLN